MKRSEQLIRTILENDIKPVPKWHFALKNGMVWTGFLLAVILGALAFSVILFAIQQTDFNVVRHLNHSRLELFLGLLPFLWIVFLIVFLVIAFISVQHSRRGYKYTVARLAGYSAALSILLGTLFFIGGGAHQLEHAFAVQVSLYESVQEKKVKLWSMPEEGYLSGQILSVSASVITLRDFQEKTWEISYDSAFIPPVVLLESKEMVKVIGTMESDHLFRAAEIRPWGGQGQRMGKKRQPVDR